MNNSTKNIKADLHIHSNFSDGKYSPKEIVNLAIKNNFSTISITDHDNINAIKIALEYGSINGIEVIPGIEFSTDLNDKEVHILAYFIEYENKKLKDFISGIRNSRILRLIKMINLLNDLGCMINSNEFINKYSENVTLGRPHLAMEMVNRQFVRNYVEAFIHYIGDGKPAYIKKPNPDIKEVVELISETGGISFLAHPGKYFNEMQLADIINSGIDGIEIIHPSHSGDSTEYFKKIAAENFLLESGGSDFHGIVQQDINNFGKYFIGNKEIINMKRRLF